MALTVSQVICLGRNAVPRASLCYYIQNREKSELALSQLKRGTGGRSSFSGVVATVFGASGFLGRKVVSRFGANGTQVIIPRRGDFMELDELKLCGDLGQILYVDYDLRDEDSLRRAMAYSNVVVNTVGRDFETRNYSFHDVHVEGARRIARIAKEQGVEKFIHLSALNAAPYQRGILMKGGSKFLKTKYEGELAVREEFPEAVILRPADMFGEQDRFINLYVDRYRRFKDFTIPLWNMGETTIKQPVFVSDVVNGIMNCIHDKEVDGKTYECIGPGRYYLSDMVDYLWTCARYPAVPGRYRLHKISPLRLRAEIANRCQFLFHGTPPYTWDKIEREHVTDKPTGLPTLKDLGVILTPMERVAPHQLKPHIRDCYYTDKVENYAPPIQRQAPEFVEEDEVKRLPITAAEILKKPIKSNLIFEFVVFGSLFYTFVAYIY